MKRRMIFDEYCVPKPPSRVRSALSQIETAEHYLFKAEANLRLTGAFPGEENTLVHFHECIQRLRFEIIERLKKQPHLEYASLD